MIHLIVRKRPIVHTYVRTLWYRTHRLELLDRCPILYVLISYYDNDSNSYKIWIAYLASISLLYTLTVVFKNLNNLYIYFLYLIT